jgi:excisionase family DNA binding protein
MQTVENPSTLAALPKLLIDARTVGNLLGCSWRTVYRLADSGALPPGLRLGGLRRWPRQAIEEWVSGGCKPVRAAGKGVKS